MKTIFLATLLFSTLSFAEALPPKAQVYKCVEGNNDSICEQKLRLRYDNGRVSAVTIEYVGYCGSQGPYLYPCLNGQCTDGVIEVNFINENAYDWKNLGYDIYCRMEKE